MHLSWAELAWMPFLPNGGTQGNFVIQKGPAIFLLQSKIGRKMRNMKRREMNSPGLWGSVTPISGSCLILAAQFVLSSAVFLFHSDGWDVKEAGQRGGFQTHSVVSFLYYVLKGPHMLFEWHWASDYNDNCPLPSTWSYEYHSVMILSFVNVDDVLSCNLWLREFPKWKIKIWLWTWIETWCPAVTFTIRGKSVSKANKRKLP